MAAKKYNWILLDLDDTIFDYGKTEFESLKNTCKDFFGRFDNNLYESYSKINKGYWKKFQNDEVSLDEVKVNRFLDFSRANFPDVKINPKQISERFIDYLSESVFFLDGALDLLEFLQSKNYDLSIITNGIKRNQLNRIALAGIEKHFTEIIISEDVGKGKPSREYFDYAKKKIGFVNERTLVIGDNLESDIRGGVNYGIDTCWFNLNGSENKSDLKPTYVVNSFDELKTLLDFK